MKVIVDFDNTINVKGCDVDDAFALFFLMSVPEVEIIQVTTSLGNSDELSVWKSTQKMWEDLKIDLPLAQGGYYFNDAGKKIAELVNKVDDVNILSLGSTTNTRKALDFGMDPKRVKSITLMGGITEELHFKKMIMDELNLSVDYLSTIEVLKAIDNVNIITGNNCMPHRYKITKDTIYKSKYLNYIKDHLLRWLDDFVDRYDEEETILWDVIAAMYMTNPELYEDHEMNIKLGKNLVRGFLTEGSDKKINAPYIKDGVHAMTEILKIMDK